MEKFFQVVLQRRSRKEKLVVDFVAIEYPEKLRSRQTERRVAPKGEMTEQTAAQHNAHLHHQHQPSHTATHLGLVVLEPVRFIHHQTCPLDGTE